MLRKIRHVTGPGLLFCGAILLAWACFPVRQQMIEQTILPTEMQLPNNGQPAQAVLQSRRVILEWPDSMRIGDSEEIKLIFEPGGEATIEGNPGIALSNIYDRFNLMAEGRFEVAGVEVKPANPVRESLTAGQSIVYKWKITAEKAGLYPGKVWLSLRFLPLDGKASTQSPIFITRINLKLTSLGGMSGPAARLLGELAIILGIMANIDVMIAWIGNKISQGTRRNSK